MVLGPDGNLWFTDNANAAIGEFNPTNDTFSDEFSLPASFGFTIPIGGIPPYDGSPYPGTVSNAIVAGPDGNLWFTNSGATGGAIGMINPATGAITEFPIPTGLSPSGDRR